MKKFSAKRALLLSVLSMVICISMLIGSTFAWFTDSATANVNTIQSGNLEIALEKSTDGGATWTDVAEGSTLSFLRKGADGLTEDGDILWEPGCTFELPMLRVSNSGNLALKYQIVISGATSGNTDGRDGLKLLEVLKFTPYVDGAEGEAVNVKDGTAVAKGMLVPAEKAGDDYKSSQTVKISAHMDETAGNDYKDLKIENISIKVVATQATYESDSNGNQYDKFAEYGEVKTTTIPAGDAETVNSALDSALRSAVTTDAEGDAKATQIVLPANTTATINSGAATAPNGKAKVIKITGDKTTTVALVNTAPGYEGKLSYQDGASLTFQGITVDAGAISGICARGGEVTFIDCTIVGELKQTIASKFVFSGCVFTAPVSQVGYGCSDVVFENCKFDTNKGYGIKIYREGTHAINLTVTGCEFTNSIGATKPAILIDHLKIAGNGAYTINVTDCTFNGFDVTPTATINAWAAREIDSDLLTKSADGQVIVAYQTVKDTTNGNHMKLTAEQLVVTVK